MDEPFNISEGFADSLKGRSVLISTYWGNQLLCFSFDEAGRPSFSCAVMDRPKGISVYDGRVCVACWNNLWIFQRIEAAVLGVNTKGSLLIPKSFHETGDSWVHEIGGSPLLLAATRLNCIACLDPRYTLHPIWKPNFISKISVGDSCHLNGMAFSGDIPRWVTALGSTDKPNGWREKKGQGCVIDFASGEIAVGGLENPHSPLLHQNKLFALLCDGNALGYLAILDPLSSAVTNIASVPGFLRGLAIDGNTAYIGSSRHRNGSEYSKNSKSSVCYAIDIHTGEKIGSLTTPFPEIFSISIVDEALTVIDPRNDFLNSLFYLPS